MKQHLRAGFGRADITPPIGTLLMGYPDPHGERRAESVLDPLYASAVAFFRGEQQGAIVSLDACVIEDDHFAAIRSGAAAATGLAPESIIVCTTQTHSAPRTQLVWGWCDLDLEFIEQVMIPGAVEAIRQAVAAFEPVRVGIGVTQSAVGINRRPLNKGHQAVLGQYEHGLYDPEMTVLRIECRRGTLANIVHYGAHPTVLSAESRVISRDWPGVMVDRVEHLTKAPTLFINGAVGDVAPRVLNRGAVGDGLDALREVGSIAATDAMRAWRSIKEYRDLPLDLIVRSYELPFRPLTPLDEAQRQLAVYKPRQHEPGAGMCEYKHWQAVIAAHHEPPRTGESFQQTILGLGPVALVPFPGEPFAETILRMRELSPFQYTLCASTSGGNHAYFPTLESLPRGGYEPWVGKAFGPYLLAEHIADVLIDRNVEMLHHLYGEMEPAWPDEA